MTLLRRIKLESSSTTPKSMSKKNQRITSSTAIFSWAPRTKLCGMTIRARKWKPRLVSQTEKWLTGALSSSSSRMMARSMERLKTETRTVQTKTNFTKWTKTLTTKITASSWRPSLCTTWMVCTLLLRSTSLRISSQETTRTWFWKLPRTTASFMSWSLQVRNTKTRVKSTLTILRVQSSLEQWRLWLLVPLP